MTKPLPTPQPQMLCEASVNNKLKKIAFSAYKAKCTNKVLRVADLPVENNTLLRTVAHDLRNPIGGIYSLVSLLMADCNLKSEHHELLMLIKESAYSSLKMVNSLLSENNVCEVNNKAYTDINEVVNSCIKVLQFKAAEKNQRITLNMADHAEMLYIDKEKVGRVVDNIISNAIKFTPSGGTIQVMINVNEENIEVAVKDNGIGIPSHIQQKLFDGFSKTGRLGTCGEKSYGLGLPICQKIVEEHEGKIWVDSEPGEGSTFYIAFPKPQHHIAEMVA